MKRLKVIACEVAFRELCFCAAQADTVVDFTFMPRKLHIVGAAKMQEILQGEIDKVDAEKYDAILLAYGLCGNGIVGLCSPLPIVVPKVRDCISFFLGSQQKYDAFLKEHPKAFFFTSGWIEREMNFGGGNILDNFAKMPDKYKSMIDEFVFINTNVGNTKDYREKIRTQAESIAWTPIEIEGDNSLLFRFLNGNWSENEFAVIPPNHRIVSSDNENIIGYVSN